MAVELDLTNRDPNSINGHLECRFEDVIAEPEDSHSIDFVWKMAFTCFGCWKGLTYKLSTLLFGCCVAAEWGVCFACISLEHIWCWTPCFKVCDINCGCLKKCWTQCIGCCLDPVCMSCGYFFNAFKK